MHSTTGTEQRHSLNDRSLPIYNAVNGRRVSWILTWGDTYTPATFGVWYKAIGRIANGHTMPMVSRQHCFYRWKPSKLITIIIITIIHMNWLLSALQRFNIIVIKSHSNRNLQSNQTHTQHIHSLHSIIVQEQAASVWQRATSSEYRTVSLCIISPIDLKQNNVQHQHIRTKRAYNIQHVNTQHIEAALRWCSTLQIVIIDNIIVVQINNAWVDWRTWIVQCRQNRVTHTHTHSTTNIIAHINLQIQMNQAGSQAFSFWYRSWLLLLLCG